MSAREFRLKRDGYYRQLMEDWKKVRAIAYYSLVATGAIDTRKMSIEAFMPLSKDRVSNSQVEALKRAKERYEREVNGRNWNES